MHHAADEVRASKPVVVDPEPGTRASIERPDGHTNKVGPDGVRECTSCSIIAHRHKEHLDNDPVARRRLDEIEAMPELTPEQLAAKARATAQLSMELDDRPLGTRRDASGRLQSGKGYVKEVTGGDVIPATPGATVTHELSDAGKAEAAATTAEYAQHKVARDRALGRRDKLADELGVDKDLLGSQSTRERVLEDLLDDGADPKKVQALRQASEKANGSAKAMNDAAEQLGLQAAEDVYRSKGARRVSGGPGESGGAGTLDAVYDVPGPPRTLAVVEAKGGGSQLGDRTTARGPRAQQGSPEYLQDLLERDPHLRRALALPENADIKALVRSGAIKIEYHMVQAPHGGKPVLVTEFVLAADRFDQRRLQLSRAT